MNLEIYLCRHGETAWSHSGQHTSFTDLELTESGIKEAQGLKQALEGLRFDAVFSSSLKRAKQTAEIVGHSFEIDDALFEWRYGEYEGLTTPEIREKNPGWNVFDFPSPGGESVEQIEARVQPFIDRLLKLEGRVLLFSSGHISRVIGAMWIELGARYGKHLALSTASLSILGFERESRCLKCWNNTAHIR